jgi:chemotaxis protein MotB
VSACLHPGQPRDLIPFKNLRWGLDSGKGFLTLQTMPRLTWIIASTLSVVAIVAFLATAAWQKGNDLEKSTHELSDAQSTNQVLIAQISALREELAANKAKVEELRVENEKASQAQKSLEEQMRSAIESKDVTISELQGKLTVNILDRILFDSGEAELKPEGEKVLQKIGGVLAQYPNRQIHVIGHTDNVPIRVGPRTKYPSNWELSTARATAAVRFLCDKAGADPRRIGAVGYGEFHPIADNSTTEGRSKNRRIALVVLPEELAGTENNPVLAKPSAKPAPEAVTETDSRVVGK